VVFGIKSFWRNLSLRVRLIGIGGPKGAAFLLLHLIRLPMAFVCTKMFGVVFHSPNLGEIFISIFMFTKRDLKPNNFNFFFCTSLFVKTGMGINQKYSNSEIKTPQ